jgi:hypothetical protein
MTEAIERLMAYAESESRRSRDWIKSTVDSDHLEDRGWPEFMPAEIREAWPALSLDARLLALAFAFRDYLVCDLEQVL